MMYKNSSDKQDFYYKVMYCVCKGLKYLCASIPLRYVTAIGSYIDYKSLSKGISLYSEELRSLCFLTVLSAIPLTFVSFHLTSYLAYKEKVYESKIRRNNLEDILFP